MPETLYNIILLQQNICFLFYNQPTHIPSKNMQLQIYINLAWHQLSLELKTGTVSPLVQVRAQMHVPT